MLVRWFRSQLHRGVPLHFAEEDGTDEVEICVAFLKRQVAVMFRRNNTFWGRDIIALGSFHDL